MPSVVSRITVSLSGVALLGGLLAAAVPAAATVPQGPAKPDLASSGSFTPLAPARILDTRPSSALAPSSATTLKVTGKGGVPSDGVAAVVLNLTAVTPAASGYLSAYPTPGKPTSSNLNFSTGRTIANLAVVPVNQSNGTVQIYNGSGGRLNVLADVTGWFGPTNGTPTLDGAFAPTGPTRLLDTRPSNPVPAGGTTTVQVTGRAGIPAGVAGAAFLNVTAVGAGAAGYLTVYPGGTRPTSSNLNFATGQTVAGAAAVRLSASGSVTIYNAGAKPLQITVDVAGWFRGSTASQSGLFSFLSPARVFDTRSPKATLAPQQTRTFAMTGRAGIPTSGVAAVVLTVTVTNTAGSGYLTVYPGGAKPVASTLNHAAGQTVPNLVVVPVQAGGTITVFNGSGGTVDVLADVSGFVRSSNLSAPSTSRSRYVNDLLSSDTPSQIAAKMTPHGCDDATAITDGDDHFTLLQFGAQSNKVPAAGGGTTVGVLPPNTQGNSQRLTYAQVVSAVEAYIGGVNNCRTEDATGAFTIAVGTSNDGYAGSTYPPATKGTDWASQVVAPLVTYGNGFSVSVVGASDIEPNFDGTAAEVRTWVSSFLAGNSLRFVNNGAAPGCPSTFGQTRTTCQPVANDHAGTPAQTWSQADYVSFSRTLAPTRISVLPQIYFPEDAVRWENMSLTSIASGTGPLTFAGVLTQFGTCGSDCGNSAPEGWAALRQALDGSASTASTALPTVSEIDYDS